MTKNKSTVQVLLCLPFGEIQFMSREIFPGPASDVLCDNVIILLSAIGIRHKCGRMKLVNYIICSCKIYFNIGVDNNFSVILG